MKKSLYKETYKAGYNSRENATDIPFESCQSLVNAMPGHPNPVPREGIVEWYEGVSGGSINGEVFWSFPFKTVTENYLILLVFDKTINKFQFWAKTNLTSVAINTLSSSGLSAIDYTFSKTYSKPVGTRIKNSVYIVGLAFNSTLYRSYIIDFADGIFVFRAANISASNSFAASQGGSGSAIPAGKFVSIAVTQVYRNDAGSFDDNGPLLCDLTTTIGFNPGVLESTEIYARQIFENVFSDARKIDLVGVFSSAGSAVPKAMPTHVRYYITDAQTTQLQAEGAAHKWVADVPITGTHGAYSGGFATGAYTFDIAPGVMEGNLNLLLVIGYEDYIPAATAIFYHAATGRLWVGGLGTSEQVGRWYYCELPLDLEFPQKWLSMFRVDNYFKDTSLENSESGVGIGLSRGDLIFLMTNSIWNLRNGDPDTFEPEMIDSANGTSFAKSITQVQRDLYYLGNNGPCVVAGREVITLEVHTAGEVWPIAKSKKGYFFTLANPLLVIGFFFKESWWLADESKIIGFYMPMKNVGKGAWEIRPQDPLVKIRHANVFDQKTCLVVSSTSDNPNIYQFLKDGENQDSGMNFHIRSRSMALLAAGRDRGQAAEAFDLILNAHWTDARKLDVIVRSNYFRYRFGGTYDETPPTDGLSDKRKLTTAQQLPIWRYSARQGFPEGLVGNHFDVEWVKEYATPFDFEFSGFSLNTKPAYSHPLEFLSRDLGEGFLEYGSDLTYLYLFDANSDVLDDESKSGYTHTFEDAYGFAARFFTPTMVPSGGDDLHGALGSGFVADDWDGLDDDLKSILDGGVGEWTRQFVFQPDPADQEKDEVPQGIEQWLEVGGNSNYFYGIKVTAAGDVVLGIVGPSFQKTYTAVGAVVFFDQQHILQFSLRVEEAGDTPEAQLYIGLRSAAFPSAQTLVEVDIPPTFFSYPQYSVGAKRTYEAVTGDDLISPATVAVTMQAGDLLTILVNCHLSATDAFAGSSSASAGISLGFNGDEGDIPIEAKITAPDSGASSRVLLTFNGIVVDTGETIGPSGEYSALLCLEISPQHAALFKDGKFVAAVDVSVVLQDLVYATILRGTNAYLTGKVDYYYAGGLDGYANAGNGLGIIQYPTKHVFGLRSNLKIAYARGLQTFLTADRAQSFHEAMRAKSL